MDPFLSLRGGGGARAGKGLKGDRGDKEKEEEHEDRSIDKYAEPMKDEDGPAWTEDNRTAVMSCIDMPRFPDPPPHGLWEDEPMPPLDAAPEGGEALMGYMDLLRHPAYQGRVELCDVGESDEESEGTLQRRAWLREAIEACVNGEEAILRDRITKKGVDVNAVWDEEFVKINGCEWRGCNRTLLHYACMSDEEYEGNLEVIALLIKLKANLGAQTDEGDTPLHYACLHGNADVCIALVGAGADPSVRNLEMPLEQNEIGEFLRNWEHDSTRKTYDVSPEEARNVKPPCTPYEMACLAQDWSSDRTRYVMWMIDDLWEKEGHIDRKVLMPMVQAGERRFLLASVLSLSPPSFHAGLWRRFIRASRA